jgi:DNA-binding response OmpR family regulator
MDSRSTAPARQNIAGRRVEGDVYDDSCLHIEHRRFFVSVKGTPIRLTKTEFRVLSRLVRDIHQIVPIQDLWDYAWGNKTFNRKSLHVFVSRVRGKLSPLGLKIDAVVGVGYLLSHSECCSAGKLERNV